MGKVSYLAIADRIYTKREAFKKLGLIQDTTRLPSHDTIRRILTNIDSTYLLEETLYGFYNFLKSLERNVKKIMSIPIPASMEKRTVAVADTKIV